MELQETITETVDLTPIKEDPSDFDVLERAIRDNFKRTIYLPLIKAFGGNTKTLQNAAYTLIEAIRTGRVQFNQGKFTGKFSARISKDLQILGATWDRSTSSYRIRLEDLPYEYRAAITSSYVRFTQKLESLDKQMSQILPVEIADKLQVAKIFDTTLWKVERDVRKSMKRLSLGPTLNPAVRKKVAEEYETDLRKWVKDFTEKEILELRAKMKKTVLAGNRFESAVKTIQESYGVSVNKAKFLARQETGLLMSKYKEARYIDAGVTEYRWNCVAGSPNHPVRPRHRALADASKKGKVFRWDDPPITSEPGEPARHNNPGQDFNCRCFATPIVRFKKGKS